MELVNEAVNEVFKKAPSRGFIRIRCTYNIGILQNIKQICFTVVDCKDTIADLLPINEFVFLRNFDQTSQEKRNKVVSFYCNTSIKTRCFIVSGEDEKEVLKPTRPQNIRGKQRPIEYTQIIPFVIDLQAVIDGVLSSICESDPQLRRYDISVEQLKLSLVSPKLYLTGMAMIKLFTLKSEKPYKAVKIQIKDLKQLISCFGNNEHFENSLMLVCRCIETLSRNVKVAEKYIYWAEPIHLAGLINSMVKSSIIVQDLCLKNLSKIFFSNSFLRMTLKYPEIISDKIIDIKNKIIVYDCPKSIIKMTSELIKEDLCQELILENSAVKRKVDSFLKEWITTQFRYRESFVMFFVYIYLYF